MTRDSLINAVRAAIKIGTPRSSIDVPHWAKTFSTSCRVIRDTWEAELTKSFNSSDGVEGK